MRYNVTAAIIINTGKVLCMQRPKGKYGYISEKFEFPGGKLEQGESIEKGLMRELKEELDLELVITKDDFFMKAEHDYPDFSIMLHSFICPVQDRRFKMLEHKSYVWLDPKELLSLDWAPADMPIVKALMACENLKALMAK